MINGTVNHKCRKCGKKFSAYRSAERIYCGNSCAGKVGPLKHGESRSRLYSVWRGMKSRCANKSNAAYKYYGGRGIRVCAEWVNSYESFSMWAKRSGYRDGLELDRVNNNGNYCPSNCQWATRRQQMANTRKRCDGITSKYKGVSALPGGRWRAQCCDPSRKSPHIGVFMTQREAAIAYDDVCFKLRGLYAALNFPNRKHIGGVKF